MEKEIEVNEESHRDKIENARYQKWLNKDATPAYQLDFLHVNKYEYAPKIVPMGDVFNSSEQLQQFQGIFDPDLRTTENFIHTGKEQKELAFVPDMQKKCYQLVFSKENDRVVALMVDPIEAGWLRNTLSPKGQADLIEKRKENKEDIKPYQHQAYILDLENGFTQSFGSAFTAEEQQRIAELTVQAKFYNGYLVYSKEEWEYLKKWVAESNNAPLMQEVFEKSITSQPGQYKFYEQSEMRKFLTAQANSL